MDLFSQFFQENQKKFLSFAYSYTRNKAAAEDILMEAMASLWENREKWEKDSNLHALLLTIIKNKSLNYLEHEQVRMKAEEAINTHKQRELDLRISTLEACEPATIFDTEIQRIVYKTLEQLPEQSRHIFILSRSTRHFYQKCRISYHQSIETVASRTQRLSYIPTFLKKTSFSFRVVPGYPVIYTEGGNKASDNT